jgi:DNA-binding NtrC family response regulator
MRIGFFFARRRILMGQNGTHLSHDLADKKGMATGTQHFGLALEQPHTEHSATGADRAYVAELSVLLSGPSPSATLLRGQICRVAPYFRTALLTGEPGCGDEAVARSLHGMSPLHDRMFLELTPSEAKLWLSGGTASASLATAGMIYLPQPERLDRADQASLLRLLRTRGSHSPRLVAYAEHGLRPLVSGGAFLPELASIVGSLRIALPPLRDRAGDVPEILAWMLQRVAEGDGEVPPQLTPALLAALLEQNWPQNLDQLQEVAKRLWEQKSHELLDEQDLQAALNALPQKTHDRRAVRMVRLEEVIQEHIRAVLFACGGNKLRAAEVLGISRSTLYRMLEVPLQVSSGPALNETMRLAG